MTRLISWMDNIELEFSIWRSFKVEERKCILENEQHMTKQPNQFLVYNSCIFCIFLFYGINDIT